LYNSFPKVSVIIPTYNRAWCVAQAITSVLKQTYTDFELIVVDDGSTDETPDVLREITKNCKNVRCFRQDNKGASAARNLGIAKSRGEYITFLDSDDLWKKKKLEEQVSCALQNSEHLVFYTDEIWIRNGGFVNPMKKHAKHSGWIFQKCLPLCIISPSSVFMHASVFSTVGLFDEEFVVCEDYDMWLRLSNLFYIHWMPKRLIIKHGGHEDQLSHKYWGNDLFRLKAILKIIEAPLTLDFNRKMAITELKSRCKILHTGFLKRGKHEESKLFEQLYNSYEVV